MPAINMAVEETIESRGGSDSLVPNQKFFDLEFLVWDQAIPANNLTPLDVIDATRAVLALPPYSGATLIDPPKPDPIYGLTLQTMTWKFICKSIALVTCRYGVADPPSVELIEIGFTTAGGNETILHSLATLARYAATGEVAPNFDGAINVTKDGIRGMSRPIPQLAFWVQTNFNPDDWNAAAWQNLADVSQSCNLYDWHGWPAGHILFEHAECPKAVLSGPPLPSGSPRTAPVKFYFKARRPETIANAPGISFTKNPFDYVWPNYRIAVDNDTGARVQKIQSMNREQVFMQTDFAVLGMGS